MKTIAVIFGGRSTEHDVSIVTALASIIKPLEASGLYQVEPIYIAKNGSWYWDDRLKDINLYQSGEIDELTQKTAKVSIQFDDGLVLIKSSQFAGRKKYQKIDVVFPALHGTHGEDGELMGLLQMAAVPFVGCSMEASVIAMDKVLAKQIAEASGIKNTPWKSLNSAELSRNHTVAIDKLKGLEYPLFVKPAHLGSSIGITKVSSPDQLNNALEVAAHYDEKIIVEQAVQNLVEVTLPIIGNDELTTAYLEQPITSSEDFFDFDTKYMQGGKKGKVGGKKGGSQGYSKIPADLPKDLYEKAEEVGVDVYKALGSSGIARVDMLINSKTQEVFFNEVNPLPGGLYAHNWRKKGISSVELVTKLVDLAEEKFKSQATYRTSFQTNYLKQF